MLAGLGKWARKAKQTAAAEMARTEAELRQVQDKVNEDWEDGVPEPEKRVFPRPNFARYKWTLRTCFEHDWKFIRPRFLKDLKVSEEELKEVEECLKEKYMWVMPLYRKLSSEETNEGGSCLENISQFGVSRRSVLRILGSPPEGINILDKVTFTQAKATELYKQTNFVRPEETANFLVRCDTVLSRHQFAEFLVRAALIKWPDQPKVKAIENLFEAPPIGERRFVRHTHDVPCREELAVLCKKYSGDMRELITSGSSDEVQAVYEAIEPQTWSVFVNMASVHENLYGQKYMTLQDWRSLASKYGAYTFRMGLEPQADEQYNKTWQLMSFLEFQRALGAVMFLSEMRTKKEPCGDFLCGVFFFSGECPPTILAALLEKIAKDNLRSFGRQMPDCQRQVAEGLHETKHEDVNACDQTLTQMGRPWRFHAAYLKTREYAAAVCDAAAVLQMRFHEAKAWARYAQALRGLGAELLASRVDAADDDAPSFTEGVAEWQRVTFASVMAAARLAAEGTYSLSKASSLVAAKRALPNMLTFSQEAANDKYKQGDFVAAVQGYTKALACDPAIEDAAAIFGNLAHCRLCLAQPHCAIAAAAACLRLLPSGAVAMKAAHRLAGAVACTGELSLAESVAKLFDALPLDAPTAEAARRQCEKLVRHRELLERLQEGAVTGSSTLPLSTTLQGSADSGAGSGLLHVDRIRGLDLS
eukprot:g266.t1